MKSGWLYVASNTALKQIKIGRSEKRPTKRRIKELFTTGVPEEFKCEYEVKVKNFKRNENKIHFDLEEFRYSEKREFFEYPIHKAIAHIKQTLASEIIKENIYFKSQEEVRKEVYIRKTIEKEKNLRSDWFREKYKRDEKKRSLESSSSFYRNSFYISLGVSALLLIFENYPFGGLVLIGSFFLYLHSKNLDSDLEDAIINLNKENDNAEKKFQSELEVINQRKSLVENINKPKEDKKIIEINNFKRKSQSSNSKKIINCINCGQKIRIEKGKSGNIKCPTCQTKQFIEA